MTYHGIDWGVGTSNRNPETGIRYGIMSRLEMPSWFDDELEYEYAYGCPHCGVEIEPSEAGELEMEGNLCSCCGAGFADWEACGEEPVCCTFSVDGVVGSVDSDGDVLIYSSPWITHGSHCSPCAPGAVTVGWDPVDGGVRAYGPNPEWKECDSDE